MYRTHPVVGFVLVAVGAVWVGQGLGLLRGRSFMVDDVRWAIIGATFVVLGMVVMWRSRRGKRPAG